MTKKDLKFKSGRGGIRKGAGRPKKEATKVVNFRVTLDLVEGLKSHGNRYISEQKIRKGFKKGL
jgi:hypothetical protein